MKNIISLLVSFFLLACAQGNEMILKAKDVQFLKAEEVATTVPLAIALKISGLAFHSSLAVHEITKIETGDELTILVHLTPAKKGLSGSFTYDVTLPPNIKTVYFGNEKTVIWEKK